MELGLKYIIVAILILIVLVVFFVGILPRLTQQGSQADVIANKTLEKYFENIENIDTFKYENFFSSIRGSKNA